MSVLEPMGSGHNRELTRERKLHPATVASMRLQNAILGRQSTEFNDHCCQQANALMERNPDECVGDYASICGYPVLLGSERFHWI